MKTYLLNIDVFLTELLLCSFLTLQRTQAVYKLEENVCKESMYRKKTDKSRLIKLAMFEIFKNMHYNRNKRTFKSLPTTFTIVY